MKLRHFVCLIIVIVLCISLMACASKDVSGLGSITMDGTGENSGGGIGTLGQPSSDSPSSEPSQPDPEGGDQSPAPEEPAETPAPANTLSTEQYSCEDFSMLIPSGWQVYDMPYNAGGGIERLIFFVVDPTDPNNHIFFATALEPFFTSASDKDAWAKALGSPYEWSPVLPNVCAEEVLKAWGNIYTMIQIQGGGFDSFFKNYSVNTVKASYINEASTANNVTSEVLANVSIPNANSTYSMYFRDDLMLGSGVPAYNLNGFFTSYNNIGIVIREDLSDAQLETLLACINSIDVSGFNNKYNN